MIVEAFSYCLFERNCRAFALVKGPLQYRVHYHEPVESGKKREKGKKLKKNQSKNFILISASVDPDSGSRTLNTCK